MLRRVCAKQSVSSAAFRPAFAFGGSSMVSGSMSMAFPTTGGGQKRSFALATLSPSNWSDWRRTKADVEEELPEVFAEQPQEIDDYIRPEKTFFESLEDYWDWIIGFFAPVEKQIQLMHYVRDNGFCGISMEMGGVFMLWGIGLRLLSLPAQLYVHRNSLRLQRIAIPLAEINNLQKKTKGDRSIATADKRIIKEGYNRMKNALHKKHRCSQTRTLVSGITTPFMVSGFLAVRRMATYDETLETTNFMWITDLTMPDPTWILPITCVGLFVINYEMNQGMSAGGRASSKMYMRWGIRCGSLVFLYFFQAQPAALFSYWIGMSLAGLLSPIILRWAGFRTYFDFPPRPAASVEAAELSWYNRLMIMVGLKKPAPEENDETPKKQDLSGFSSVRDFEVLFDEEVQALKGKNATK
jgi:membrane protein insertase Oxa1/YidC/SpoIIIJ